MLYQSQKIKVLVTGGNGYIAKSITNSLKAIYDITSINRSDFDLTDGKSCKAWFAQSSPFDVVIHTASVGGSRLKPDTDKTFYQNMLMFYNLLENKNHFGRLLSFGSGAEFNQPYSHYGLGKNIINNFITYESEFYNIRIFATFDENELDSRFIKANIKRYINRQPIEIFENKFMDFFYMKDLIKIVKYYIEEKKPAKTISCSYFKKTTLLDVANIINNLSDYKCEIDIKTNKNASAYSGLATLDLDFIGLEKGIKEVWKKLN